MDLFMMNCELLATCSALGYLEGDEYYKEDDCIDSVKCLIKYLHNEDSQRDIRIQMGAAHILQDDLLPIVIQYCSEEELFSAVLRLIINLTQPALLCFGGKVPKDTVMHHHFLNALSYNQAYKEAFGKNEKVWKVLTQKIYEVLETEWENRKPDDSLLVERCLILVRNLLHTPATVEDRRKTSEELTTHDNLIWQMHQAGFDNLLLYMSGSSSEQEWTLHLVEIICLLLKEQNAAQLVELTASSAELEKEGNELLHMRQIEDTKRKVAHAKLQARHSRFGGTYVALGTRALADDKDVIMHRSLANCQHGVSFDDGKARTKKAKNRRALVEDVVERRSSRGTRVILNRFCRGFLERGYNTCLRVVKDRLQRENAQDHDETYYFWTMSFFLKFNRLTNFRVELVSETLQLSTLHFLDMNLLNYYELMLTDKQEAQSWSRRMHLALRCYEEFLLSVQLMSSSMNEALRESAKVLLNNVFYVVEHREIFVIMLRKFDERKQTRAFLKDIILTTHLFLKMFENFCKGGPVVVEKKVRAQKRKKSKQKKKTSEGARRVIDLGQEAKSEKWSELENLVAESLQIPGSDSSYDYPAVTTVFDPTLPISEEEQQQRVFLDIQRKLLASDCTGAVRSFRVARTVWPESGLFGASQVTHQDELNALREVCLADLSDVAEAVATVSLEQADREVGAGDTLLEDEEDDSREEDADEEERAVARLSRTKREVEFDYQEYIKKFADANIMRAYTTMLQCFKTNGEHLNHCIVKMLHRVAYSLKMYGFLFQASIFRLFQKIQAVAKFDASYKEVVTLSNWVVRKFFEVFERNPVVIAEMLFWKRSCTDVCELTEGYGTHTRSNGKSNKVPWTEGENVELSELFHKHRELLESGDLMDAILSEFSNPERSRKQIASQLVEVGLVEDVSKLKKQRGSKSAVWRQDDVDELTRLYQEYCSSQDPIGSIMSMMGNRRPKNRIIEKLVSLGLVTDRKSFHKRSSKPKKSPNKQRSSEPVHIGGPSHAADENDEIDSPVDTDDDEDGEDVRSTVERLREEERELNDECLRWLSSSLKNCSDDRRASADHATDALQPVPLVPFTVEQETAISNRRFRSLLKKIGLQPPANKQEVFWRIPSTMSAQLLAEMVEALEPQRHLTTTASQPCAAALDSSDDAINDISVATPMGIDDDAATSGAGDFISSPASDSDDDYDRAARPPSAKRIRRAVIDDDDDDD